MLAKNSNVPKSSPPLVPFIGTITYKLISFSGRRLCTSADRASVRVFLLEDTQTEKIDHLKVRSSSNILRQRRFFMTSALVHRIYRIALVVALCAAFMGVALLLHPMFEGVSPADEILRGSGSYSESPPVW